VDDAGEDEETTHKNIPEPFQYTVTLNLCVPFVMINRIKVSDVFSNETRSEQCVLSWPPEIINQNQPSPKKKGARKEYE
jgi:hypothetical protein